MYDILFLADAQDLWLFNYFLLASNQNGSHLKIIYDKTGKVTSPHTVLGGLKECGISQENLIRYEGSDSTNFKENIANCRWFITKDFLPTGLDDAFLRKCIVVSWVGESARLESHNPRHGIVRPGYQKLYVEKSIQPLYTFLGFASHVITPKYYFLNHFNREVICNNFNLDPTKKYVTIFSNPFFDSRADVPDKKDIALNDRVGKIFSNIKDFCQKNDIQIILKNKAKYAHVFSDTIFHHKYVAGNPGLAHPGVMLMAISEFSIGFATSAAIEAEEIGARFISFWKHDFQKVDESLFQDILVHHHGQHYRLAQGDDTFIVNTGDTLDDIMVNLDLFMKNSKPIEISRVETDSFLKENFGDF